MTSWFNLILSNRIIHGNKLPKWGYSEPKSFNNDGNYGHDVSGHYFIIGLSSCICQLGLASGWADSCPDWRTAAPGAGRSTPQPWHYAGSEPGRAGSCPTSEPIYGQVLSDNRRGSYPWTFVLRWKRKKAKITTIKTNFYCFKSEGWGQDFTFWISRNAIRLQP